MGQPVVHFEFGARDGAKLGAFYGELFGWTTQQFGPATTMFDTGTKTGIMGHISQLGHEPHNYCLVYIGVDDIDAYVKKAEAKGAKLMIPKTEVPQMGHFAWVKDPEGNVFGLWTPMQPGSV